MTRTRTLPMGSWTHVYVGKRRAEVFTLGEGSPVLFLHGWGLSPRSYRHSLAALSRQGHLIVAPTLPGFGRSDPLSLRHQNVGGVAAHIAEVMYELGLDAPVHVVGHSFGGGVSLRLGVEHPELVRSLTLVCPVGGAGDGVVPLTRMVPGVLFDARHMWAGLAVAETSIAFARNPASVLAAAYSGWRSDQIEDLRTLDIHGTPTRFLFADSDTVVSPGAIPASVYAKVTCEVVAGNHSWLITHPERFAHHVSVALKDAEAETP